MKNPFAKPKIGLALSGGAASRTAAAKSTASSLPRGCGLSVAPVNVLIMIDSIPTR